MIIENVLLTFLVILALSLVIPEFFKKFKIPFFTSIILIGAVVGPHGFNYVQSNNVVEFFGFLGMAFLMFMAGLEADLGKLKTLKKQLFVLAGLNGLLPFAAGIFISRAFGYSWLTSFLVGTIFISSSIAIVAPSLKSAGLFNKSIGQLILSVVLLLDILSLVVLGFILQNVAPITNLPLFLYLMILIISVAVLFYLLPRWTRYLFKKRFPSKTEYEERLRFVLVILISVLLYFSVLGVHPILAAFLTGLTLSVLVKSKEFRDKFNTLGYGLFVPVFFFIVGMKMDLSILTSFDIKNLLMVSIIFGLIISKFCSGYFGGKLVKLSSPESLFFGTASTIQITTTLSVTYAASSLGILDSALVTAIIIMSVITTLLGPLLLRFLVHFHD